MQRPPIMRALTMPASDFPYGNTIGLDSPFAPLFLPSLSLFPPSTFIREEEEIQAPFSLSRFVRRVPSPLSFF